jgi:hypothetical protein
MALDPCDLDTVYQNFKGLRTKCNDFIDSFLANNFKMYCIKENWLNNSILSHNLFCDSYCVFRADIRDLTSNTKREGGVFIAVSKSFRGVKHRYDLETDDECVLAEIHVSNNYNVLKMKSIFTRILCSNY